MPDFSLEESKSLLTKFGEMLNAGIARKDESAAGRIAVTVSVLKPAACQHLKPQKMSRISWRK